jgi:hypothetical protein
MAQDSIKLVGYLQAVDKPIVSLYCNMSEKSIFVRLYLSDATTRDVEVSANDVLSYIYGLCNLRELTNNQYGNDGTFIDDLCTERNRIEYFLTHINEFFTAGVRSGSKYRIYGKRKTSTIKRAGTKV